MHIFRAYSTGKEGDLKVEESLDVAIQYLKIEGGKRGGYGF